MTFACTIGGGQHSSQCENNGGSEELDSEASRYIFKTILTIVIVTKYLSIFLECKFRPLRLAVR